MNSTLLLFWEKCSIYSNKRIKCTNIMQKKSVPNGTLSDYVGTNRLELLTSAM